MPPQPLDHQYNNQSPHQEPILQEAAEVQSSREGEVATPMDSRVTPTTAAKEDGSTRKLRTRRLREGRTQSPMHSSASTAAPQPTKVHSPIKPSAKTKKVPRPANRQSVKRRPRKSVVEHPKQSVLHVASADYIRGLKPPPEDEEGRPFQWDMTEEKARVYLRFLYEDYLHASSESHYICSTPAFDFYSSNSFVLSILPHE